MTAIGTITGRIIKGIRAGFTGVVIICFAYMTLAVLAQVLGRYVFNYSISWTEETAKFAQIWVVPDGGRHHHAPRSARRRRRPPRHAAAEAARPLSIVVAAGGLWFLGIVIYGSLPLIELGWMFERSPVLLFPMWIIYLCLPIGAFYFAIEIVLSVIERWDQPFGQRRSSDAENAS